MDTPRGRPKKPEVTYHLADIGFLLFNTPEDTARQRDGGDAVTNGFNKVDDLTDGLAPPRTTGTGQYRHRNMQVPVTVINA